MLTLDELNETVVADRKKIKELVESYRREEPHGDYKIQWALDSWYGGGYDTAIVDPTGRGGEYVPGLRIVSQQGVIRYEKAPGVLVTRVGEIKTALELWIAGNGPWPEPREATMETVQEAPPVLPPAPPLPPPERETMISMRI